MCASTVSSKMLVTIAEIEGFYFEDTLTGFKRIGWIRRLFGCEQGMNKRRRCLRQRWLTSDGNYGRTLQSVCMEMVGFWLGLKQEIYNYKILYERKHENTFTLDDPI